MAAAIAKGALPKLESLDVKRTRLAAAGRRLLDEAASASGGRLRIVHDLELKVRSGFCIVS